MAKRANGEGTIYQDKNGLWRGEITLGFKENGTRIAKKFSSKNKEVLIDKMNLAKADLQRGVFINTTNQYTVEEWLKFWLLTYKANSVKPRTYDYYEGAFTSHVYKALGKIKLDKLKQLQIQQLYNKLHEEGFATSTIRSVHIPLNQALEQAISNELIYKNPCKGTTIPKKPPRIGRAMTVKEQAAFEAVCSYSHTHHLLCLFLIETGLRIGECLGLTHNNVDRVNKVFTVNGNLSIIKNRNEAIPLKNIVVLSTTKSESGNRTIPLSNKAERILDMLPTNSSFVFSSRNNTPLRARAVSRTYAKLLEKADLPDDLTLHSLRHTFATRLLEKGADMKVVSELLGHKSISITYDIYSHVMLDLKRDTIKLLDEKKIKYPTITPPKSI